MQQEHQYRLHVNISSAHKLDHACAHSITTIDPIPKISNDFLLFTTDQSHLHVHN